jgi:hypothetical protein
MLINRAFGDAGRFADKLTGAHFVASFTAQPPRSFLQRRAKTDPRAVNRSRASGGAARASQSTMKADSKPKYDQLSVRRFQALVCCGSELTRNGLIKLNIRV